MKRTCRGDDIIRIDKEEPVKRKQNTIRLKMQTNPNATNQTLRDLVKEDSLKVIATADMNLSLEVSKEKLDKVKQDFLDTLNA